MDEVLHTKIDLVVALGTSERLGYNEGVDNHFSCLVPGTEYHFYINPHRMHWSEICVADLVELDFSGLVLDGKTSPEATAFFIHSSIHRRCPEAFCGLHTHMRLLLVC